MPIDLTDINPNNAIVRKYWHFAFEGGAMNSKLCFPLINIVLLALLGCDILPFGIPASVTAGARVVGGPETALVFSCKNARTKTHVPGKFGFLKTAGSCRSSTVSSSIPRLIVVRESASVLSAFETWGMETESV